MPAPLHFADALAAAVRRCGNPVLVGLDPRWESLPLDVRSRYEGRGLAGVAMAYEVFCSRVLDVVAPLVPVVKPQAAFFEACGPEGLATLQRLRAAIDSPRMEAEFGEASEFAKKIRVVK